MIHRGKINWLTPDSFYAVILMPVIILCWIIEKTTDFELPKLAWVAYIIIYVFLLSFAIVKYISTKKSEKLERQITRKIQEENRKVYWGMINEAGVFYLTSLGVEVYYNKGKFFGAAIKAQTKFQDYYIPLEEIAGVQVKYANIILTLKDGKKSGIDCVGNTFAANEFKRLAEEARSRAFAEKD